MKGIKIAKPSHSVDTANPVNLYVDTELPILKVFLKGSGKATVAASDGFVFVTITHNLGYIPVCQVFVDRVTYPNGRLQIVNNDGLGLVGDTVSAALQVFDNNMIIVLQNIGAVAGTYRFFYYIFYDRVTI